MGFIEKQKTKSYAFLRKNCSLANNECETIFQESLVILWKKLQEVDEQGIIKMTSTSTFFLAICKNKAREFIRENKRMVHVIDNDLYDFTRTKSFKQENVDFVLTLDSENDIIKKEREEQLRNIVNDLPEPCDGILWGFYRDELSLKELAERFHYKSEGTVKVTKHRCLQKLINRYKELNKISR